MQETLRSGSIEQLRIANETKNVCECANTSRLSAQTLHWIYKSFEASRLSLEERTSILLKTITNRDLGPKVVLPHTIVFRQSEDPLRAPVGESYIQWYYTDPVGVLQVIPTSLVTLEAIYFALTHTELPLNGQTENKANPSSAAHVSHRHVSSPQKAAAGTNGDSQRLFQSDIEHFMAAALPPALSDAIVEPQAELFLNELEAATEYDLDRARQRPLSRKALFHTCVVVAEFTPDDPSQPKIALTPATLRKFLLECFVAANREDTIHLGPRYLPKVSGVLQQYIAPQRLELSTADASEVDPRLIKALSTVRRLKQTAPPSAAALPQLDSEEKAATPQDASQSWSGAVHAIVSPFMPFLRPHPRRPQVQMSVITNTGVQGIPCKDEVLGAYLREANRLPTSASKHDTALSKSKLISRPRDHDSTCSEASQKLAHALSAAVHEFGKQLQSIANVWYSVIEHQFVPLSSQTSPTVETSSEHPDDHFHLSSSRELDQPRMQGTLLDFELTLTPTIPTPGHSPLFWLRGVSRITLLGRPAHLTSITREKTHCVCVLCCREVELSQHAQRLREQRELFAKCPNLEPPKISWRLRNAMKQLLTSQAPSSEKQASITTVELIPRRSTDALEAATLMLFENKCRTRGTTAESETDLQPTTGRVHKPQPTNHNLEIRPARAPGVKQPEPVAKPKPLRPSLRPSTSPENKTPDLQQSAAFAPAKTAPSVPPPATSAAKPIVKPLSKNPKVGVSEEFDPSPLEGVLAASTTVDSGPKKPDHPAPVVFVDESQYGRIKRAVQNRDLAKTMSSKPQKSSTAAGAQSAKKRSTLSRTATVKMPTQLKLNDAIVVESLTRGLPVPQSSEGTSASRKKTPWVLPAGDATESIRRSKALRASTCLADRIQTQIEQQREIRRQKTFKALVTREHVFETYRISRILEPGTVESMTRERILRQLMEHSGGRPLNIPQSAYAYLLPEDLVALEGKLSNNCHDTQFVATSSSFSNELQDDYEAEQFAEPEYQPELEEPSILRPSDEELDTPGVGTTNTRPEHPQELSQGTPLTPYEEWEALHSEEYSAPLGSQQGQATEEPLQVKAVDSDPADDMINNSTAEWSGFASLAENVSPLPQESQPDEPRRSSSAMDTWEKTDDNLEQRASTIEGLSPLSVSPQPRDERGVSHDVSPDPTPVQEPEEEELDMTLDKTLLSVTNQLECEADIAKHDADYRAQSSEIDSGPETGEQQVAVTEEPQFEALAVDDYELDADIDEDVNAGQGSQLYSNL